MKQTKLFLMFTSKTIFFSFLNNEIISKAAKSCVKYIPFWLNKLIKMYLRKILCSKRFPRYFYKRKFLGKNVYLKNNNSDFKGRNAPNRQNKYYF